MKFTGFFGYWIYTLDYADYMFVLLTHAPCYLIRR